MNTDIYLAWVVGGGMCLLFKNALSKHLKMILGVANLVWKSKHSREMRSRVVLNKYATNNKCLLFIRPYTENSLQP